MANGEQQQIHLKATANEYSRKAETFSEMSFYFFQNFFSEMTSFEQNGPPTGAGRANLFWYMSNFGPKRGRAFTAGLFIRGNFIPKQCRFLDRIRIQYPEEVAFQYIEPLNKLTYVDERREAHSRDNFSAF